MLKPQQGEVIAERYRLESEIARGGMGSVWAGQDEKLRRKVAVKLVAPDWDPEGIRTDAQEQFEHEAMAVAQLQSPHVVQVFDFGVDRGYPYIVMELLDGEDLRSRLYALKRLSLETAGHILVQTAKALSVAHAAGIVHRDLKPGNVFLVRSGEEEICKILDFGVAKNSDTDLLEEAVDDDEQVMGTPQFMAPEQARGLDVDHRADLWSLGVIVYRALTGRLPYRGRTATSVIVKVCTTDPQPVSELAPDLPVELDEFFRKALAREPDERFNSAREMALAFSRITPITFTTLSMPDPKQIEEAIQQAAKAAAQDEDDEAETMAVDASALAMMRLGRTGGAKKDADKDADADADADAADTEQDADQDEDFEPNTPVHVPAVPASTTAQATRSAVAPRQAPKAGHAPKAGQALKAGQAQPPVAQAAQVAQERPAIGTICPHAVRIRNGRTAAEQSPHRPGLDRRRRTALVHAASQQRRRRRPVEQAGAFGAAQLPSERTRRRVIAVARVERSHRRPAVDARAGK